jgi:hypothetical protein
MSRLNSEFARFSRETRREILRSLAFDYCLLWEPLGFAETIAPELDADARISLAAESLHSLSDEELVYFFRSESVDGIDESASDDSAKLSAEDVRALLATKEWARRPPQGAQSIWFGLTSKGVAALHAQENAEDVERLANWGRQEFDCMDDPEINDSIAIRAASEEERKLGQLAELRFKAGASRIDVVCVNFRRIDDLDAAWASVAAGARKKIFDTRWHNDHEFVCGYAQLVERSTGNWQVAWTHHPHHHVLVVASAATVEPVLDLFANSALEREGRRFLVGLDGRMGIVPTAAPRLSLATSRVAAYVREPHASSIRRSARAQNEAIRQAGPHLAALGWTNLEYRGAKWDDDPQEGKAFYIHFRGVPPGGQPSELTDALGAVDCIVFAPDFRLVKQFATALRRAVSGSSAREIPPDHGTGEGG